MSEHLHPITGTDTSPAASLRLRAAAHLNARHGAGAMAEAVRQGMVAQQRGDEAATAFWCAVCSLLVHMRQTGEPNLS